MSPTEIVRVIMLVQTTLKMMVNQLKTHKKLGRDLRTGLEKLRIYLDYLKSSLEKDEWESYDELRLTELVYDIEDFSVGIQGAVSIIHTAIGADPRDNYVARINFFCEEIEKLLARHKTTSHKSKPESSHGGSVVDMREEDYTPEESLVGISNAKKVILDLLGTGEDEEAAAPKVISIVGCPGVGKTALARAVYEHCLAAGAEFDCVAWVEAEGFNNDKAALLGKILQNVQADLARRTSPTTRLCKILADLARRATQALLPSQGDGNNAVSRKIHDILADKRYLVFIDDVNQAKVLEDIICYHFPQNARSGMVIVTTTVHKVANVCSSGSYVYSMKCLGDTDSEILFCGQAFDKDREAVCSAELKGSNHIISKFGGLPLALISVADHLRINNARDGVDSKDFHKVVKKLGSYLMESNTRDEFIKLRRVLRQCYEALPDYDHKNYMRSLSIFPRDHPIKCKNLVRRLVAEGLISSDSGECSDEYFLKRECLDELVNRCIMEPIQIGSCSKNVKSCRVNVGIMLEFIIHKSLCTNFVTLIREEEVLRNTKGRIRRLSVQSNTRRKFQKVAEEIEMSETLRSLTIIPSNVICDLHSIKICKFLRLLDMEDCSKLDEEFVRGICTLVHLKYLRLWKANVKKIPCEIKKLYCLQTFDVQGYGEIELPEEVMTLPKLAFLLGKFVLPKMCNKTQDFLSNESELQTVAGFVVNQSQGHESIILKAKNLRKVKVWCTDTCAPPLAPSTRPNLQNNKNDFVLSLQGRFTSLNSVSIRSSQLSQNIMASLEGKPCKISRMKLFGKMDTLPTIATLGMIDCLSKLQLSYTKLTSEHLSQLQYIPCLEYLKLQDNEIISWDGTFFVLEDGFQSLRRLCFEAPKLPKLQFEPDSMKSLTSLHLLCLDISQMQVDEEISKSIKHITTLNEVILHHFATEDVVEAWKTAAKKNTNLPLVTQLKRES